MTLRPSVSEETYTPAGLFAGDFPSRGEVVTIDTGNLAAGAVLGRITATGKYILSAAAASDGSEVPIAILSEAVDATSADVSAVAYFSGDFIAEALSVGAGWTVATVEASIRGRGVPIYIVNRSPK